MSLRKRLVLGAVLALLLTAMMGMLAYLSGAHRQLSETYEVQAALLAERMEQLQEKEAELAALEEKNNALAADLQGRYDKAEELQVQAEQIQQEKAAILAQTEQLLQDIENKRQELTDSAGDPSYYLEVYDALTEGLNKVKGYLSGN